MVAKMIGYTRLRKRAGSAGHKQGVEVGIIPRDHGKFANSAEETTCHLPPGDCRLDPGPGRQNGNKLSTA